VTLRQPDTLIKAALSESDELLTMAHQQGANMNSQNGTSLNYKPIHHSNELFQASAVHIAVWYRDNEVLGILLLYGANLHCKLRRHATIGSRTALQIQGFRYNTIAIHNLMGENGTPLNFFHNIIHHWEGMNSLCNCYS
jgi:ankyrin repeat protein